ncbi:MAG: polyprenyl synthetase family protein [Nitrospirae bacterium]|nr:polyprenyl synthetase family protein [Nitrospirota bacterium]
MIQKGIQKKFNLQAYLRERGERVEKALVHFFTPGEVEGPWKENEPSRLYQAMQYSLMGGGKRIRPILVLASAEAVDGEMESVLPAAVAVEMIHTYSLIHDDLPAMDNDAYRRGRPTNHTVYGEAMAILAGDGLLTQAFRLMASRAITEKWEAERALQVLWEIGTAAGPEGMVGGQALDIGWEGQKVDPARLESIHRRKTGALIRVSVRVGGLLGGASTEALERLSRYGEKIGLAFQVADDILDVEGNEDILGKKTQKDAVQKKNTYPAMMGLEEARIFRDRLVEEAVVVLAPFEEKADPLRAIARYIAEREH